MTTLKWLVDSYMEINKIETIKSFQGKSKDKETINEIQEKQAQASSLNALSSYGRAFVNFKGNSSSEMSDEELERKKQEQRVISATTDLPNSAKEG